MDIRSLYNDYTIRYAHDGERHYKPGWINIPCPFCTGNPGNHLGYSINKNFFKCWRCGHKKVPKVLQKILGVSYPESLRIIKEYKGTTKQQSAKINVKKVKFKFPDDTTSLIKNIVAVDYLKSRGFSKIDIFWLQKKFDLLATSNDSCLDDLDLSYRIVAPIIHDAEIVSFQTRDYTGTSKLKYITCPAKFEIKEHKTVLYNAPNPKKFPVVVLCEGIFDVWKVSLAGFPSTCFFGVEFKQEQFNLLKNYRKIIIFLDPDQAGKRATKKLKRKLIFSGKDVIEIPNQYNKDPGDMSISTIKKILKPLIN